jgi:transcriptional regulator with XRE-family HTH domain
MGLPEIIQAHRGRLRLSQSELAQRVGVRQATVSEWESGKSAPGAVKLVALADVFGVDTAELRAAATQVAREPMPAVYGHPDWLDRRIDDTLFEMAQAGATKERARYITDVLRSDATLKLILRREDGSPRPQPEQERELDDLIQLMWMWIEHPAPPGVVGAIQPNLPGGAPLEPIIPAPRKGAAASKEADVANARGKKK